MFLNPQVDAAVLDSTSALNCYNSNSDKIAEDLVKGTHHMENKTKYAFWILAIIQLPVPVLLIIFKLFNFADVQQADLHEELKGNEIIDDVSFVQKIQNWFKNTFDSDNLYMVKLTCLLSILVFLFDGLQATHSGYIFSYAFKKYDFPSAPLKKANLTNVIHHHKIHASQSDEAYITASFWAFFSIGRLASIFLATKFTPAFMIVSDLIGILLATLLLLLSSLIAVHSKFLLYLSTCLFGLALSNTTPCCYSLAEIYIGMTPSSASFVIISAALGEMILPIIVGNLFDKDGPESLVLIELFSILLAFVVFYIFWNLCKYSSRYTQFGNTSFIWCTNNNDNQSLPLEEGYYEFDENCVENEQAVLINDSSSKYYNNSSVTEL